MRIDSVGSRRAAKICGFRTVAMLDYLERSGVFVRRAPGEKRRGKGRRYGFRDLLVLKVMSHLLSNGASVQTLKKSLLEFQNEKWATDRASLSHGDDKIRYLTVSAGNLYFSDSSKNLYDMTKGGQMVFSFVIDLDHLHSELCEALDQREFSFAAS
nr:helix-turn-helix domain-containing protein [Aurantiacibacter gangjinensis]